MHTRFADAPLYGIAVGGSSLLVSVWAGWPLVVVILLATVLIRAGMAAHRRTRHPELVGALAFTLLELDLALSVLVSGGAGSPLLTLMVVPVFTQAVCFRPQVIWWLVGLSAALAGAAGVAAAAWGIGSTAPAWVHVVTYGALLLCLALAAQHLASSDRTSRSLAVVDPLTGLFNRTALAARFADVRAQAEALGTPVALTLCDVDHFKDVNDTYGHERGDDVLQAMAVRMRETVRTSDLIYRIGGEELLVLLPGHDADAAVAVAERLGRAIGDRPVAGLTVTVSAGVAAGFGAGIDLAELSARADRALYAAERDGRDLVRAGPGGPR